MGNFNMLSRRNFIIGASALTGCASIQQSDGISDDEYDIFNSIWSDLECPGENETDLLIGKTKAIDIANDDMSRAFDRNKHIISDEMMKSFYVANKKPYLIDERGIDAKCIRVVSERVANEIAPSLNSGERHRRELEARIDALISGLHRERVEVFSPSIRRVTRFGFDNDRLHAVGMTSYHCGPLCGAGELMVIRKGANEWEVTLKETLWIS
ncbi:MAG: hypothetical protein DHS20C05_22660 [Hyphococcus sp.]|nr:MAG: hypothetical protein DHS20C05_22660 [Marinicaulis sp.]